jgi:DNA-binding transcriptional LysR family regulator
MPDDVDRLDAGGHEDELKGILDEIEAAREAELSETLGKSARSAIIGGIRAEALRRFAQAHPGVKVKFHTGPYRDPDAPRGQRGRKR